MAREINAELLDAKIEKAQADLVKARHRYDAAAATLKDLLDMRDVRELLFENSRKEKTLKRFLEYCYMIDVKVALEGLNGEKTRGLKAAVKYVKEHDIGMTEEQIQGAMHM